MQKERPLSPHLQVYKPQLTSMLSILHRGTGVFLALGTPVLVLWLLALAGGAEAYVNFQACFNNWFAQLLVFGWTYALFYHLCNGIRHLFWDVGRGFEIETLYTSGKAVMLISVLMTAVTWYFAVSRLGGAA
jgi:succinate dehydrogenase / fumarate reductase cytochrome b subunit